MTNCLCSECQDSGFPIDLETLRGFQDEDGGKYNTCKQPECQLAAITIHKLHDAYKQRIDGLITKNWRLQQAVAQLTNDLSVRLQIVKELTLKKAMEGHQ